MTPRQAAVRVFESTHPVHWQYIDGMLTSPSVDVEGVPTQVVLRASKRAPLFPKVVVLQAGMTRTYRSWNPWGSPAWIIFWHQKAAEDRERTRQRLLATGMSAEPPKVKLR